VEAVAIEEEKSKTQTKALKRREHCGEQLFQESPEEVISRFR